MHVLLVEDSVRLQESIGSGLKRCGYAVDVAGDGEVALRAAGRDEYDVIVLDLMLPKVDGLSVLAQLRERGDDTHVLILTAKDTIEDRVTGLREGADDYLVKPFAFDELVARIEALIRREYRTKQPVIEIGPIAIDTSARRVTRGAEEIVLSRREYAVLELLAYRMGDVVSRRELEEHVYNDHNYPMSNAIDRVICTLRKKIEPEGSPALLHTRRGLGFILKASES